MKKVSMFAATAALGLAALPTGLAAAPAKSGTDARIASLEAQIGTLQSLAQRANDRAAVENLFSHYMYLHNAFRDTEIIPLWAKKGTPDVRAQYSNLGVYTGWTRSCPITRTDPAPRAS